MNRTQALAWALAGVGALSVPAAMHWPRQAPALDCAADRVDFTVAADGQRIAQCRSRGVPVSTLPAGAALTLGRRLDLNAVSEAELRLLPGVGPRLAQELVRVRALRQRFRSWDEVDAVAGVGWAKLQTLMSLTDLGSED